MATDEFKPKRGLRQGDLLSPLLFNLIGEVLSKLLDNASSTGVFKGVKLPNFQQYISYIQFADDVILFINNDVSSIKGVKRVLQCFQLMSGLSINFQKSSLRGFSDSPQILQVWANILGCKVAKGSFTYLGASIGTSPKKIAFWDPMIHKVKSRLDGWEVDYISMAGRLVLLKVVIDSLPIFWFNLYLIPASVLRSLEQIRRSFIWGQSENGKPKIQLISWDKITLPKNEGGLGLTPLGVRNWSLLAKWWWRCYSEKGKKWNIIMSERYGRNLQHNLYDINGDRGTSHTTKGILSLRSIPRMQSVLANNSFF